MELNCDLQETAKEESMKKFDLKVKLIQLWQYIVPVIKCKGSRDLFLDIIKYAEDAWYFNICDFI